MVRDPMNVCLEMSPFARTQLESSIKNYRVLCSRKYNITKRLSMSGQTPASKDAERIKASKSGYLHSGASMP